MKLQHLIRNNQNETKRRLGFLFSMFLIVTLNGTSVCALAGLVNKVKNGMEGINIDDGSDDQDLGRSDYQISIYDVPVYKDDGWINGELGQLYYHYVEMLEGNRNILIFFDDVCSVLDTSKNDLRILPIASFAGQFNQSCWIGPCCQNCQYDLDAFYRFVMPHKIPEETVRLELIQSKSISPQVHTSQYDFDSGTGDNHKTLLTEQQAASLSSVDFSYSPGLNDSLFSLNITLNPNRLSQKMSESIRYELSLVPLIDKHPYFNNFYIDIGCEGKLSQRALVLKFMPKDPSKLQNAQFLTDVFQGDEVLIPECGKQLTVLCSDLDESEKIVIKVTGRLPANLVPLVVSFISPITDLYADGVFTKSSVLLFIIARLNTPLFLSIQGVRLGAVITSAGFKKLLQLGNFSVVKRIRNHCIDEASCYTRFINKFTQIHNRCYNKVTQIGRRSGMIPSLLLGWFGFNQLTVAAGAVKSSPVVQLRGRKYPNPGDRNKFMTVPCMCKTTPECQAKDFRIVFGKISKDPPFTPVCDAFCLGEEYRDERCQVARDSLYRILKSSKYINQRCYMDIDRFGNHVEMLVDPVCLAHLTKITCAKLAKEGNSKDIICNLCHAAHDSALWCKEIFISDVQATPLIGGTNITKASTALLLTSTKPATELESKLDEIGSISIESPVSKSTKASTVLLETSTKPATEMVTKLDVADFIPAKLPISQNPDAIANDLIGTLRTLGASSTSDAAKDAFKRRLAEAISGTKGQKVIVELQNKISRMFADGTANEVVAGMKKIGFETSIATAIQDLQSLTSSNITGEAVDGIREIKDILVEQTIIDTISETINSYAIKYGLITLGTLITASSLFAIGCYFYNYISGDKSKLPSRTSGTCVEDEEMATFTQGESQSTDVVEIVDEMTSFISDLSQEPEPDLLTETFPQLEKYGSSERISIFNEENRDNPVVGISTTSQKYDEEVKGETTSSLSGDEAIKEISLSEDENKAAEAISRFLSKTLVVEKFVPKYFVLESGQIGSNDLLNVNSFISQEINKYSSQDIKLDDVNELQPLPGVPGVKILELLNKFKVVQGLNQSPQIP